VHVSLWVWIGFTAFVLAMLAIDLLLDRGKGAPSLRTSLVWSTIWIGLGIGFGGILWAWQGGEVAGEYAAGYLIEKSLSVDNVFVFAVIFTALAVPAELQKRVLFWGVLGALVFRGLFLAGGAALLDATHVVLYVFAAILLFTAVKLARASHVSVDPGRNIVVRALRKVLPVTEGYEGSRFLVRRQGVLYATPLLAALIAIETSDVFFALDSIPAIFAITDDAFIVFTSNAFAILGLRALTFLLAGSLAAFHYLGIGLAAILGFAGLKLALSDIWHPHVGLSLGVIVGILAVAVAASLLRGRRLAGSLA
jgi:tellurite resistance protein TerC